MHRETMRELIESGTGVLGSLLKEMLVHRNQVEILETRKEHDKELAQIRQQAQNPSRDTSSSSTDSDGGGSVSSAPLSESGRLQATPGEIEAALDELIDEEMCAVCKDLLVGLKERPTRQQVRGIMEYGTFKQNLDDGAGVEELKAQLRQTDVLQSVFQETFTGQPANA